LLHHAAGSKDRGKNARVVSGRTEAAMITLPATGFSFADLALAREPDTQRLLYRPEPLRWLMRVNGFESQTVFDSEDLACWLIAEWYAEHLAKGGEPDPVAEDILTEVTAAHFSGISSFQPGGYQEH